MTKTRFRVQDIQSFQPAIDQRNIDKVYVLDGRNYYFDSKGPKSGFGTRLVADNSLIENEGGVVQSITAGKATYIFTSKGCYVLAENQKTWIQVLDLESRWPDVPLKDDKKWTFVYLTKGVYFCHPVYGFYKVVKTPTDYYLDPRDQTDIPGLPFQPQAIFETNGRMVVLGFKYVAWSGPSNAEDFLPALGGAGQELLSDRIAGDPVTGVGFQNGFIVWTLQGCLTAEFIGGDTVFRFDRLTTEQLPVNAYAVEAMPDGSQVICTKQGLYQIQNAKEPSQIAPLFSEFIRQRLEHEKGIHVRITYALEEDLLFFQMRDWTNHYVHTYVCAIALDKWGSFDERHLGIIKFVPQRGNWGYVDHAGRPHRFIETFNREITPHRFIGLDSNITIGYFKPPELHGEIDSLLEMHEINLGGHPAIPSWYPVDNVDLGTLPSIFLTGHLALHGFDADFTLQDPIEPFTTTFHAAHSSAVNGANSGSIDITIPAEAQVGDRLMLVFTNNYLATYPTVGWNAVGSGTTTQFDTATSDPDLPGSSFAAHAAISYISKICEEGDPGSTLSNILDIPGHPGIDYTAQVIVIRCDDGSPPGRIGFGVAGNKNHDFTTYSTEWGVLTTSPNGFHPSGNLVNPSVDNKYMAIILAGACLAGDDLSNPIEGNAPTYSTLDPLDTSTPIIVDVDSIGNPSLDGFELLSPASAVGNHLIIMTKTLDFDEVVQLMQDTGSLAKGIRMKFATTGDGTKIPQQHSEHRMAVAVFLYGPGGA